MRAIIIILCYHLQQSSGDDLDMVWTPSLTIILILYEPSLQLRAIKINQYYHLKQVSSSNLRSQMSKEDHHDNSVYYFCIRWLFQWLWASFKQITSLMQLFFNVLKIYHPTPCMNSIHSYFIYLLVTYIHVMSHSKFFNHQSNFRIRNQIDQKF